jgi:hypothetical protein
MMSSQPQQIRQEIERTRGDLSADLGTLADKMSPRQALSRRVHRTRRAYERAKEKIMGAADTARRTADTTTDAVAARGRDTMSLMEEAANSATQQARHTASSMQEAATRQAREAASSMQEAVSSVPRVARQQAQGSPLAAGLIAFGAGVLISSLLPRSQPEQHLAGQLRHTAMEHSDELGQAATGTVQRVREDLREPARQAARSVTSAAGEAAAKVRDEGRWAGRDIKEETRRAAQDVTPQ